MSSASEKVVGIRVVGATLGITVGASEVVDGFCVVVVVVVVELVVEVVAEVVRGDVLLVVGFLGSRVGDCLFM